MDAEAQTYLAEINTKLTLITDTVKRLDKSVNGNGKPGLLDRVLIIEQNHNSHKCESDDLEKAVEEIKRDMPSLKMTNKILTWLGIGFGGSAIALIWAILTHSIELVR